MSLGHVTARGRFNGAICLALWLSAGCGYSTSRLAVNQPKAREACSMFLTAWKEGKKPVDLQPQIIGRDADWETGKKLESFEVLAEQGGDTSNLHLPVRLTLKDEKGRELKREVTYIVGTSPRISVFRADE